MAESAVNAFSSDGSQRNGRRWPRPARPWPSRRSGRDRRRRPGARGRDRPIAASAGWCRMAGRPGWCRAPWWSWRAPFRTHVRHRRDRAASLATRHPENDAPTILAGIPGMRRIGRTLPRRRRGHGRRAGGAGVHARRRRGGGDRRRPVSAPNRRRRSGGRPATGQGRQRAGIVAGLPRWPRQDLRARHAARAEGPD